MENSYHGVYYISVHGYWLRGVMPNYHTQINISPYTVNVLIACNNAFVMPDAMITVDDDGVVVVPIKLALELLKEANEHHEWEVFTKMKLAQGGDLRKYYPLREQG